MGGGCEIVFLCNDERQTQDVIFAVVNEIKRIEAKFSRYLATSIVSVINQDAGIKATPCDEETWSLLTFADHLFRESEGLFDITSGVFRRAWDFQKKIIPSENQLADLLPFVNWGSVVRHKGSIYLPTQQMEIDFGGFGKEYAADRGALAMKNAGVAHGYVNLAGDMHVVGPKEDGSPWLIGIRDPRHPDKVTATIPMHQGGLATSGDYERFFEREGQRYCHILNPRTGMPVAYWQSVSVIAPMAIVAGSSSTLTMLKQEQGLDYLKKSPFPYFCVNKTGESFMNE